MAVLDENGVKRLWENTVALVESKTGNSSVTSNNEIFYVSGDFDIANNAVVNLSHTFAEMLTAYNRGKTIKIKLNIHMLESNGYVLGVDLIGDLSAVYLINGEVMGFIFGITFKGDFGYGEMIYYNTLTIQESSTDVSISILSTNA